MPACITALEAVPPGPRVRVVLDGRFALHIDPLLAASLRVGQVLDDAALARLAAADAHGRALDTALRLLTYRPRSVAELRGRLAAKGYDPGTVAAVVARLQALGLLDDTTFARFWVEQRQRFRPRGAAALRAELRAKGVAPATVAAALADTDDVEAACRAGRARRRALAGLDRATFQRRLGTYLQRRGFSYAACAEAVARLWAEQQPAGDD